MEICLGLKSEAWQMSLDVRWGVLEKDSRVGTKMFKTGGCSSTTAGRNGASAVPAAPGPAPATATVFLEIWKRQRARVVLHWDLYGWDEDQVRLSQETRPRGLCGPA